MNNFAWSSPSWLWLLFVIPVALAVAIRAERRRARTWSVLAAAETRVHLESEFDPRRRRWKTALVVAACAFAVLALARPAWDAPQPAAAKGRDILILLDVSRSMFAEDLAPSRLEFAKRGIEQFAARLGGDRVGLVAFAGSAALRCPLTADYDFFRTAVEGASPESVVLGGTEIAKAIRTSIKDGFDDMSQRSKHILLITDAEDHGYAAAAAAGEAVRAGIRLDATGLGDEVNGARIPLADGESKRFLTYRGQEVWSKLNAPAIRHIANAGGGNALVAGANGKTDLGAALDSLVSGSRGKPLRPRVEGFWIPLALAVAALASELALSERRRG
jgi:Ca-activated chloride channel family protein